MQPVSTSSENQEEPVWASHSQFQWQGKTGLSQIFEELVCLCHAQQPVSTTRKNQFELVTASFNDKEQLVWASYSQFQQAVRTRKNQFELDTASFNEKENQFWASFNNQNQFQLVTASFNDKNKHSFNNDKEKQVWARKNWFEQVTTSFNNQ